MTTNIPTTPRGTRDLTGQHTPHPHTPPPILSGSPQPTPASASAFHAEPATPVIPTQHTRPTNAQLTRTFEKFYSLLDEQGNTLPVLGSGAQASVHIARSLTTGERVVARFANNLTGIDALDREIQALKRLKHSNIVPLTEYFFVPDPHGRPFHTLVTIYPLSDGTALAQYMLQGQSAAARDTVVTEAHAWTMLTQLQSALGALERARIVHCDIKPENILISVNDDGTPHLELIDFGVSKALDVVSALTRTMSRGYTPFYAAPEVMTAARAHDTSFSPTTAQDRYSVGATLIALLAGHLPTQPTDGPAELLAQLRQSSRISESLGKALAALIHTNPAERTWPSAQAHAAGATSTAAALAVRTPDHAVMQNALRAASRSADMVAGFTTASGLVLSGIGLMSELPIIGAYGLIVTTVLTAAIKNRTREFAQVEQALQQWLSAAPVHPTAHVAPITRIPTDVWNEMCGSGPYPLAKAFLEQLIQQHQGNPVHAADAFVKLHIAAETDARMAQLGKIEDYCTTQSIPIRAPLRALLLRAAFHPRIAVWSSHSDQYRAAYGMRPGDKTALTLLEKHAPAYTDDELLQLLQPHISKHPRLTYTLDNNNFNRPEIKEYTDGGHGIFNHLAASQSILRRVRAWFSS